MIQPGELIAVNFAVGLEMVGNNTYGLMIGHASVLQNARQTDNRKGRRKRGGHFPLFTGRLPRRCLFPDVPFVIEELEVLFAGKCFAIVFRISSSHSSPFCGVLSARYGIFFF